MQIYINTVPTFHLFDVSISLKWKTHVFIYLEKIIRHSYCFIVSQFFSHQNHRGLSKSFIFPFQVTKKWGSNIRTLRRNVTVKVWLQKESISRKRLCILVQSDQELSPLGLGID